jgi:transposase
LFLGSDAGGERAAILYTVLESAKLNDLDPQTWLADVIDRTAKQLGRPGLWRMWVASGLGSR